MASSDSEPLSEHRAPTSPFAMHRGVGDWTGAQPMPGLPALPLALAIGQGTLRYRTAFHPDDPQVTHTGIRRRPTAASTWAS
jgi:hypothetical protein